LVQFPDKNIHNEQRFRYGFGKQYRRQYNKKHATLFASCAPHQIFHRFKITAVSMLFG